MKQLCYFFIASVFISGCCFSQQHTDVESVELAFSFDASEVNVPFHQSDFIDSISFIRILSDDNFANISSMKYCKGKYYILDANTQVIWVIDSVGELFGKIDHRGRARDEYLGLYKFDVNPKNGNIYIYDQPGGKVIYYSPKGKFISSFKLSSSSPVYRDFIVFPTGNILCCKLDVSGNIEARRGVWLVDSTGRFIRSLYEPDSEVRFDSIKDYYFWRINDTLVGMKAEPGNDNIYHFTENSYSYPKYHITSDRNYDHSFLKKDVLSAKRPVGCYEIHNYFETSSIMFCDIITNTEEDVNAFHQHCIIYYDKRFSKEIVIKHPENYVFDMKFLGIMGSAEDRLFYVFTPGSLPEEYQKMYPEFEGCNQPVIQVAYLKK